MVRDRDSAFKDKGSVMELRHLRYFIAVALEENITRAAEKLHVSQPALSRQVRDLEEELGFSLLQRSAKSVSLTEAGRVFLDEASDVIERLEKGIRAAEEVANEGGGEIHVGYAPSLTTSILPPAIRLFQSKLPNVRLKLHDLSSDEMQAGLRSEKLDFAFLVCRGEMDMGLSNFVPLKYESMCLAVIPGNEANLGETVTTSELSKLPLVGYSLSGYPEYGDILKGVFGSNLQVPKLKEEHESVTSLIASVEAGIGNAIVTKSLSCVSGGRIKLLNIVPNPPVLTIGLGWAKTTLSSRERAFLEAVKEVCSGLE